MYASFMTACFCVSLSKVPYIHRKCIVLANPDNAASLPISVPLTPPSFFHPQGLASLSTNSDPDRPLAQCMASMLEVVHGLASLHERGIVHRDLKCVVLLFFFCYVYNNDDHNCYDLSC